MTGGAPLGRKPKVAPPPRKLSSKVHMGRQKKGLVTSPWTECLGQRKNLSNMFLIFLSGISRTSTKREEEAEEPTGWNMPPIGKFSQALQH